MGLTYIAGNGRSWKSFQKEAVKPLFQHLLEAAEDRHKQSNLASDRIEDRSQNFPNTTLECYLLHRGLLFSSEVIPL
jgi:hypothetical protein